MICWSCILPAGSANCWIHSIEQQAMTQFEFWLFWSLMEKRSIQVIEP